MFKATVDNTVNKTGKNVNVWLQVEKLFCQKTQRNFFNIAKVRYFTIKENTPNQKTTLSKHQPTIFYELWKVAQEEWTKLPLPKLQKALL